MESRPPVTPERKRSLRITAAVSAAVVVLAAMMSVLWLVPQRTQARSTSVVQSSVPVTSAQSGGSGAARAIDHKAELPPRRERPVQNPIITPPPAHEVAVTPSPVPVLMYHDIASGPNSLYVPPTTFGEHLDALKTAGYHSVTLDQLYLHFTQGKPLPPHPIVLTFDDGYASFYTAAWPMLKQRGYTGTVYVITGSVDKPGYVTWNQLREMSRAGAEIGSHSVSHLDMAKLDGQRLHYELADSRRILEEELGRQITAFCYPSGRHNAQTVAATKAAGYHTATTIQIGLASPEQDYFEWKRLRIGPNLSGPGLVQWIESLQPKAAQ